MKGRGRARDAMGRLAAAATDESKQIAADMGDPQHAGNQMFWATLDNVVSATGHAVDSGSPELRTVLDLSRTVTPRQRDQWADAKRVMEEMFEELDGGVTLADRFRGFQPDTGADDRDTVLAECATFYKVPPSYVPAVGNAVTAIMRQAPRPSGRDAVGQPARVCKVYSYVVGAIAVRALPETGAAR